MTGWLTGTFGHLCELLRLLNKRLFLDSAAAAQVEMFVFGFVGYGKRSMEKLKSSRQTHRRLRLTRWVFVPGLVGGVTERARSYGRLSTLSKASQN